MKGNGHATPYLISCTTLGYKRRNYDVSARAFWKRIADHMEENVRTKIQGAKQKGYSSQTGISSSQKHVVEQ